MSFLQGKNCYSREFFLTLILAIISDSKITSVINILQKKFYKVAVAKMIGALLAVEHFENLLQTSKKA